YTNPLAINKKLKPFYPEKPWGTKEKKYFGLEKDFKVSDLQHLPELPAILQFRNFGRKQDRDCENKAIDEKELNKYLLGLEKGTIIENFQFVMISVGYKDKVPVLFSSVIKGTLVVNTIDDGLTFDSDLGTVCIANRTSFMDAVFAYDTVMMDLQVGLILLT